MLEVLTPKLVKEKVQETFDTHPDVEQSDKRARSQETTGEQSKKAKPDFSLSKPDFSLDPANPPKYCPECAWDGIKSRVKKMKSDDNSRIIMCRNEDCPWPFSVATLDEATILDPKLEKTLLPVVLEQREPEPENDLTSILYIDTKWAEYVEDELHTDKDDREFLLAPVTNKMSWNDLVHNNFTKEEIEQKRILIEQRESEARNQILAAQQREAELLAQQSHVSQAAAQVIEKQTDLERQAQQQQAALLKLKRGKGVKKTFWEDFWKDIDLWIEQ